jgi:hypothetical protein
VPIDAANRPLSTPPNPNGLRAAHVPTLFPAATVVTELPDDINRSIGWTYCVGTAGTAGDGPYAAVGIVACNRVVVVDLVHIMVQLIVISIVFSSFNDVDLFRSMPADCCMPRRRGWGTITALGRRRPPWLKSVSGAHVGSVLYVGLCWHHRRRSRK